MAYYDSLVTKWATLSGTTAAKISAINALTIQTATQGVLTVTPSQVLNCIVFADLASLSQIQLLQLTVLLSGATIDATKGSQIRTGIQTLFSGKTTTLANLSTLVAAADAPLTIEWWRAKVSDGGGGLNGPIGTSDLIAAGNLT